MIIKRNKIPFINTIDFKLITDGAFSNLHYELL
jgi:hypothetical protein